LDWIGWGLDWMGIGLDGDWTRLDWARLDIGFWA